MYIHCITRDISILKIDLALCLKVNHEIHGESNVLQYSTAKSGLMIAFIVFIHYVQHVYSM